MIRQKTMSTEESYSLRERLHTDVLEEKYGKIDVQVLYDDDRVRKVLLSDRNNIARTYAMTQKTDDWRQDIGICAVNTAIRNGEPIGKAFKSRRYIVQKNVLAVYTVVLPEWLQQAFAVTEHFAKARATTFIVSKGVVQFRYGYVTEIYSPDFRPAIVTPDDIAQIKILNPTGANQKRRFSK
jgi:hypothetical protein